jgi:uncharacterized membrane protein
MPMSLARRVVPPRAARTRVAAVAGAFLAGCGALGFGFAGSTPAQAQGLTERISDYEITIDVGADGDIDVVEEITYDFGNNQRHGIFRWIPYVYPYDGTHDRIYEIDEVDVASPDAPDDVSVKRENGRVQIKVGDPDETITGEHHYTISYSVSGAMNAFDDHDELYMNAIGNEWVDVGIDRATVVVNGPASIERVACFAGAFQSRTPCENAGADGRRARFSETNLGYSDGMSIVVGFPKGAVAVSPPVLKERWSFERAFTADPAQIGSAGAVLAVGGIGLARALRRRAKDEADPEGYANLSGNREGAVEFRPPEGVLPAQLGVLIDETADPLDVTATIVDLAVRGYLRIEETKKDGLFRDRTEWTLRRLHNDTSQLRPYEAELFGHLFSSEAQPVADGGPGDLVVEVSELKREFSGRLAKVQKSLYSEVVELGWFRKSPELVRGQWLGLGILALIIALGLGGGLVAWSTFGLLGLALVVLAVVIIAVHRKMPSRTGKGSLALSRSLGFGRFIRNADADMLRYAEQENIFAKYLPYAVVFKCTEKWAKAFAGLDQTQLAAQAGGFYVATGGFDANEFTRGIERFSDYTSGVIVATPASKGSSGVGGGGFSGGGFGGGGGGSW